MQIKIKDLEPTKVELTVTIPSANVEERLQRRLKELGARAQFKGFRPGKVPATLLKSMLGDQARSDTLNDLLKESYPQALADQRLHPLEQGSIESMEHEPGRDFTYVAVVEVAPRVTARGYTGLAVTRPRRRVGEDDVAKALEQLRHEYANWTPVEDDGALDGDQLLCDIQETTAEGLVVPNRLYKGIRVELGKRQYGSDFDLKMAGARAGETRDVTVVNAADDPDPEIAGKTEHYRVTVHELKRPQLAELDDDFAREVPPGFDTLEELRARVGQDMAAQLERAVEQQVDQRLIAAVMERNPVELPQKMVDQQLEAIIAQARKGTENPIDEEIVRRSYDAEVRRNLGWSLVSAAIIAGEGLAVTPAEVEADIARTAAAAGQDARALRLQMKRAGALERHQDELQARKLMAFLREHAAIGDEAEDAGVGNR